MSEEAKKPRGYIENLLVVDCETTGLALGCDDPTYNPDTGEKYQSISWGLIVANAQTFKAVEKLYVEIKWDGKSVWSPQAERVHGLSKKYLEQNGVSKEEAVEEICNLILKYWGPTSPISLCGHNVATFDKWFLRRLTSEAGIDLRFSNRHLDSYSVGMAVFNTYNSDDLFDTVGLPARDPSKHNALTDAEHTLETVRRVNVMFKQLLG